MTTRNENSSWDRNGSGLNGDVDPHDEWGVRAFESLLLTMIGRTVVFMFVTVPHFLFVDLPLWFLQTAPKAPAMTVWVLRPLAFAIVWGLIVFGPAGVLLVASLPIRDILGDIALARSIEAISHSWVAVAAVVMWTALALAGSFVGSIEHSNQRRDVLPPIPMSGEQMVWTGRDQGGGSPSEEREQEKLPKIPQFERTKTSRVD